MRRAGVAATSRPRRRSDVSGAGAVPLRSDDHGGRVVASLHMEEVYFSNASLAKAFFPGMKEAERGRIVAMASATAV